MDGHGYKQKLELATNCHEFARMKTKNLYHGCTRMAADLKPESKRSVFIRYNSSPFTVKKSL
jgi:hypothetical protein